MASLCKYCVVAAAVVLAIVSRTSLVVCGHYSNLKTCHSMALEGQYPFKSSRTVYVSMADRA
jgi:hypothetical protein